ALALSLTLALSASLALSTNRSMSLTAHLTSSLTTWFAACKATGGWATLLCGRTLAIMETAFSTQWDHLW
ncbi:hypothetical protein, partial [Pseudomonas sp. Q1]|uniref:hypothetical protein n=1 Tax=Pseudomonas sp. Q1 TaxID=2202823 RepID=UPI001C49B1DB